MRNSEKWQIKFCNAQIHHVMTFFKSTKVWKTATMTEPTQYYIALSFVDYVFPLMKLNLDC